MSESWDVFDTLIGRKCGTPERLRQRIANDIGMDTFPEMRAAAERSLQGSGDYSLADIYARMEEHNHLGVEIIAELIAREWKAELDNTFPIFEYASQVKDGDILVSDMYLDAAQIQQLLLNAGIDKKLTIYVSCYGKTKASIWKDIWQKHGIEQHCGDNQTTDVNLPKKKGYRTLLAQTGMNADERFYLQHSVDLAWWCRYRRLSMSQQGDARTLAGMQIDYNVPFLLAKLQDLRRVVSENNLRQVLFLARDGCLAHKLWQRLYPEIPSQYVYASRECLRNATPGYVAYLNSALTEDSILADLAASCCSLKCALPHLTVKNPHVYVGLFVPKVGESTRGMREYHLLNQKEIKVNNTFLEMLNYATHWHVADVSSDGVPILDQCDEYDMRLVQGYHDLWDDLLTDVPNPRFENPVAIAEYSAKLINAQGRWLSRTFPGHMKLELSRRLPVRDMPRAADIELSDCHDTVIVGAIDNYEWDSVRLWSDSIRLSGFAGRVHMLCYRISRGTIQDLVLSGIVPHECKRQRHVVVDRFCDLVALAAKLPPTTWVISLDVGDLVAQTDPDVFLDSMPDHVEIVVGSETIRIGDQWWVRQNLADTFPEYYAELAGELLYNAGSFAMRAGTMREFAGDVWALCTSKPYTKNNDQEAFNLLLHSEKYRDRVHFAKASEGWCYNSAAPVEAVRDGKAELLVEPVGTIEGGAYRTPEGFVPCFLHHYPRFKEWHTQVVERINAGRQAI